MFRYSHRSCKMTSGLDRVMQRTLKNIPKASASTVASLKLDIGLEDEEKVHVMGGDSEHSDGSSQKLGIRSVAAQQLQAGKKPPLQRGGADQSDNDKVNGIRSLSRFAARLEKQEQEHEVSDPSTGCDSPAATSWVDPTFHSSLNLTSRMGDWERAMELLVRRIGHTTVESADGVVAVPTEVFNSRLEVSQSPFRETSTLEDQEYKSMIEGFGAVARICSHAAAVSRSAEVVSRDDEDREDAPPNASPAPLCVPSLCTEWIVRHPLVSSPQRRQNPLPVVPSLAAEEVHEDEDSDAQEESPTDSGFHSQYHTMSGDQYLHYCRSTHEADKLMLALTLYHSHFLPSAGGNGNSRLIPRRATIGALMACDKAQQWESALDVMMQVEVGKKTRREQRLKQRQQKLGNCIQPAESSSSQGSATTVVVWAHEAAQRKKVEVAKGSSESPAAEGEGSDSASISRATELPHYICCGAEVAALMLSLLERNNRKEQARELLMAIRPKDRQLIAGAYSSLIHEWGHHTGTKNISKFW